MTEDWIDLASRTLGGSVVAANDETFAAKENLIADREPAFSPGVFGPRGQVYDGWETRRRREEPGSDWVVVRLGAPGIVHRVVVDTAFFVGNYPPECELASCWLDGWPSPAEVVGSPAWQPLTGRVPLRGGQPNAIEVAEPAFATHVRLTIHPDGGVARLRVLGEVLPDPRRWAGVSVDLAAAEHGGRVLDCSDGFYSPPGHVLLPGSAATMADGWETRRRRAADNDWLVVALGVPGQLRQVLVDTSRFVGNAPAAVRLSGYFSGYDGAGGEWGELLPRTRVQADTVHWFGADAGLDVTRVVDRVRCDLIPDGGVARLRLVGVPSPVGRAAAGLRWWNALPAADAARQVAGCNAAQAWATALVAGRSYPDLDAVVAASSEILGSVPWPNIEQALAAHPRIGEAPAGSDAGSAASRAEQSGVSDDTRLRAALADGNRAYERRFGHVYLVRARGRSGQELLALLQARLRNDNETEAAVVRRELAEITALRLRELW